MAGEMIAGPGAEAPIAQAAAGGLPPAGGPPGAAQAPGIGGPAAPPVETPEVGSPEEIQSNPVFDGLRSLHQFALALKEKQDPKAEPLIQALQQIVQIMGSGGGAPAGNIPQPGQAPLQGPVKQGPPPGPPTALTTGPPQGGQIPQNANAGAVPVV